MTKVAYIFPGQGAQYVGMGKDFYQRYSQAKAIFEQANSILDFDLTKLIFQGPIEELSKTINSQVAIFTVSVACLKALEAGHPPFSVSYTAGLSLGEYAALVAAGAFSFAEGLKLVKNRAQYMEQASCANPGGMLSVIGLPLEIVEEISQGAKVEVANLNCPGQIVISGSLPALEKAKEEAEARGAKKVVPLKVGGAFHSSLMAPAAQRLVAALEEVEIRSPKLAVVSNVTAKGESSPQEIKDSLARQVVSRTLWEESVKFIGSEGIKCFLELGPGKVLKGLLRRIDPQLTVYNIGTVEELEKFIDKF